MTYQTPLHAIRLDHDEGLLGSHRGTDREREGRMEERKKGNRRFSVLEKQQGKSNNQSSIAEEE